jgi:hypothetical protein
MTHEYGKMEVKAMGSATRHIAKSGKVSNVPCELCNPHKEEGRGTEKMITYPRGKAGGWESYRR